MWFKKKANISGFNPNTAEDGTDWRTNFNGNSWSVSHTLPDAADAGNYFYLPALGYYSSGQLYGVGYRSYYWSSSADPWNSSDAYNLNFNSGYVYVNNSSRYFGFRAEALQYSKKPQPDLPERGYSLYTSLFNKKSFNKRVRYKQNLRDLITKNQ